MILLAASATLLLLLACVTAAPNASPPPLPTNPPVGAPETTVPPTPIAMASPTPEIVLARPTSAPTSTPIATTTASPSPVTVTGPPQSVVYAPILMYHSFDNSSDVYSVRPSRFQEQIEALRTAGFTGVTLHQIVEAIDDGLPLPPNPVAITIDDARETQKLAVDILDAEGFPATLFVPSGWHELSRSFIVQLDRSGFEIGSHTVWHVNLAHLPQKRSEIREGKKAVEDWLGHPIEGFAYPYGAYRPADVEEVRRVGFRYAVTIRHGVALRASERYVWPRLLISNDDPFTLVKRLRKMLDDARAGREPPAPASWG